MDVDTPPVVVRRVADDDAEMDRCAMCTQPVARAFHATPVVPERRADFERVTLCSGRCAFYFCAELESDPSVVAVLRRRFRRWLD
jgi:hypothetical protein